MGADCPEVGNGWGDESQAGGRIWFYHKDDWDPGRMHRWGWPLLGGDEFKRKTIVFGFWFIGYVVIAYARCYCEDCEQERKYERVRKLYGPELEADVRLRDVQRELAQEREAGRL